MIFTNSALKDHIASRITIDTKTKCWVWNKATDRNGYARTNYKNDAGKWTVLLNLHRHVFVAYNGAFDPATPVIRHTCNNRRCINPDHLIQGTQKDNVADAIEANTHSSLHQQEVRRLTPDERRDIYECLSRGETIYSVAKKHNTSMSNVFEYKQRLPNWLAKQEKKAQEDSLVDTSQVTITETLTFKEA